MLNYQRVGPNMSQAVTIRLDPSCGSSPTWRLISGSGLRGRPKNIHKGGLEIKARWRPEARIRYTQYTYIYIIYVYIIYIYYIYIHYIYIYIYIDISNIIKSHQTCENVEKHVKKDTPARNRVHFGARKVSDTVVLVLLSTYVFVKIDECVSWIS